MSDYKYSDVRIRLIPLGLVRLIVGFFYIPLVVFWVGILEELFELRQRSGLHKRSTAPRTSLLRIAVTLLVFAVIYIPVVVLMMVVMLSYKDNWLQYFVPWQNEEALNHITA